MGMCIFVPIVLFHLQIKLGIQMFPGMLTSLYQDAMGLLTPMGSSIPPVCVLVVVGYVCIENAWIFEDGK